MHCKKCTFNKETTDKYILCESSVTKKSLLHQLTKQIEQNKKAMDLVNNFTEDIT